MNRCREIPASRNKGDTRGETPFSAFFEEFKRTVLAVFCQFIRENGTSGVGYIDYENFTAKTVDPKKIF